METSNKKEKKPYVAPKMEVIKIESESNLLACSGNDNAYWDGCHEGWQGGWGED